MVNLVVVAVCRCGTADRAGNNNNAEGRTGRGWWLLWPKECWDGRGVVAVALVIVGWCLVDSGSSDAEEEAIGSYIWSAGGLKEGSEPTTSDRPRIPLLLLLLQLLVLGRADDSEGL